MLNFGHNYVKSVFFVGKNRMPTIKKIALSWQKTQNAIHSTEEILQWVDEFNKSVYVNIRKIPFDNEANDSFWYIDKDTNILRNKNNSFFSVCGAIQEGKNHKIEQPIILQNEIGYLGFICKEIEGTLYFLVQAKIEPGNINKIQLSPTIQATKSNFMQLHGGNKPPYLDYFLEASKYEIIVDQIQSEQSSRFYKKRNRNIIIKVDVDVEVLNNFCWVTLGQLKELMKVDNLVNMDSRTVLSCIPFSVENISESELAEIKSVFKDEALYNSIFIQKVDNDLPQIYQKINNYKMFSEMPISLVGLDKLNNWEMKDGEFVCKNDYHFKMIYCDIEIEGREVKRWQQPLFEANGKAIFGLFTTVVDNRRYFLVKLAPEIGCLDILEIGATLQLEAGEDFGSDNVALLFKRKLESGENVLHNVILSEEGGRFYHEQNHNVIIDVNKDELGSIADDYHLLDYYTLNQLVQINNCLNIQLRNLLSLLKVGY